jgi:hypothetical protein
VDEKLDEYLEKKQMNRFKIEKSAEIGFRR